ncbi:MAG: rod shape-determining protein MreC [Ilumatobacteraceae bacterium]
MGIYSPVRRRLIIALLLSSVLLLTLDLRGNQIFDTMRNGFQQAMDPLESAAEVVSRPIRNAWRGITQYDDLADENEDLRRQLEAQRADQITYRAAVIEFQALLELNNLPSLSDYDAVTARVIGETPNNLDQIIEIDKGEDDGIDVGMAVVSEGGLVGKVTRVFDDRSFIMLVRDQRFAVRAKVPGAAPEEPEGPEPPPTSANAIPHDDLTTTTTLPPSTTTTVPGATSSTAPGGVPGSSTSTTSTTSTTTTTTIAGTTTTTIPPTEKETGTVVGQGRGEPILLRFVRENIDAGRFEVGDAVMTEGGEGSLSPPDIPIGTISRIRRQSGSAGPMIEVQLGADLERLSFVRIVLYQSLEEAAGDGG